MITIRSNTASAADDTTVNDIVDAPRNGFDTPTARQNSRLSAVQNGKLVAMPDSNAPTPLAEFVHDGFRALVLNPKFACAAAKSAFSNDNYLFAAYDTMMASDETSDALAYDLAAFKAEQDSRLRANGFSTFVAVFNGPVIFDEEQFELLLWKQLQLLHERDARFNKWDETVGDDPDLPDFEFSFAERAFFVVGMHPANTRWTRRFAWPALVFNAHFQFDDLRAQGKYGRMQEVIRKRDQALQGTINANLADFGEASDARQYSGRPVEDDWKCPFHSIHSRN